MYEIKKMERYLLVHLLGPSPCLMKKEFTGRGLTNVEKHCSTAVPPIWNFCQAIDEQEDYNAGVLHLA